MTSMTNISKFSNQTVTFKVSLKTHSNHQLVR